MTPLERAKQALHDQLPCSRCLPDGSLEINGPISRQQLELAARAVLQAFREPTDGMQKAAFAQKVSFRSGSGMSDVGQLSVEYEGEPGAATVWRAMIDAALEER